MGVPKFAIEIPIRGVDKISGVLGKIERRVARTTLPFRRLQRSVRAMSKVAGVGKLGSAVGAVGTRLVDVRRQVGLLGRRFSLLTAAAGGAVLAIVRGFARAGDSIAKTASRLGIGVEALQELRFAAERSGVAQNTLDMALQRFGRRVGEAAQGTGEARVALRALGISVLDAAGNVRTLEDLLPEVADKLSRVESENVRNALAMKFFDSEGVAMVQMLGQGSAALEELRSRARELGVVMSADMVEGAQEFTDRWTDLLGALSGARNVIAIELLPHIQALVDRLRDLLVGNRDRIRAFAREFAAGLPERLERLKAGFMEVKRILQPLLDVLGKVVERLGWAKTAVLGLALVIGGKLLIALGALVPAIFALGAAILTTPIGWILLGVAAVISIFGKWGSITDWIVDKLTKLADIGLGWLADLFGSSASTKRVEVVNATAPPGLSKERLAEDLGTDRLAEARAVRSEQLLREESTVRVAFDNLPAGARVIPEAGDVPLDLGFANAAP